MKIKGLLFSLFVLVGAISMTAQSHRKESKWATLDDNKIHYYDIGNAKTKNAIVFIHGWTCNADFWKDSYNAFPNYRVIAIDLPGHGQSDKPKLSYSMEHFAKAINAVMKEAGVRR